jgi:hypothetical protein
MKFNKITNEHILHSAIFLFALIYRLSNLGGALLNDAEAALALKALGTATGQNPVIGSHTLYTLLTGILFFFFGANEFLARLIPALAGSLLVLAPRLFKPWLDRQVRPGAVIVLSILIALEPAFVAASRTADSRMLAVAMVVFCAGFLVQRQYAIAGIFAGLSLLSGPFIWPGLIGIAAARIWNGRIDFTNPAGLEEGQQQIDRPQIFKKIAGWAAGTLVFGGSLFFIAPAGLSGMLSSLPDYVTSWSQTADLSPLQVLLALVVFQPLEVMLGLAALGWNWHRKDPLDAFLWKWWLAALLLALANPGVESIDLAWSLVPLGALSARQLVRLARPIPNESWPLAGQTGLSVILLVFAGYSLISMTNTVMPNQTSDPVARLAIFGGAVLLLVFITLLVAWGWSTLVASFGLAWGVSIILAAYTLSGSWSAAGLGRTPESNIWRSGFYPSEGRLLASTVADFSLWKYGRPEVMEVTVLDISSPAMEWLLRGQRSVNFTSFLPATSQPPLLITHDQKQVNLASSYTGQDFVWEYAPAWDRIAPPDWLRWIYFRESVVKQQTVVLWVRSDIFPAAAKTTPGGVE